MVYETASVEEQEEFIREAQERSKRVKADEVHRSLGGALQIMDMATDGKFDFEIISENEVIIEGRKITPAFQGRAVMIDGEGPKKSRHIEKIANEVIKSRRK